MTAQRENRRFRALARKAVSLGATVSHVHAGWRLDARVTDLSLGGARVLLVGKVLSPGDRLKLSLIAPTLWDAIELNAVVAWQHPIDDRTAVGVWFEGHREEDLLSLFDLLATVVFATS